MGGHLWGLAKHTFPIQFIIYLFFNCNINLHLYIFPSVNPNVFTSLKKEMIEKQKQNRNKNKHPTQYNNKRKTQLTFKVTNSHVYAYYAVDNMLL